MNSSYKKTLRGHNMDSSASWLVFAVAVVCLPGEWMSLLSSSDDIIFIVY